MGPRSTWTAVDDYVIENWGRVRELAEAFTQTQRRIRRNLRSVAEQCEPWLAERGYRVDKDRQWAEFYAWRPEWEDSQGAPRLQLAVGAVCPAGYYHVEHRCPYLGIVPGPSLSTDATAVLRSELHTTIGGSFSASLTLADEWEWALVAELDEYGDVERAKLGADPSGMFRFVTGQFKRLMDVDEHINAVVAKLS